MKKLVVNADDFGLSEKVNEGILCAHQNGILTSTSIMANGMAFQHAVDTCKSNPTLDVGIHLTLVEEKPLLNPAAVPDLVTDKGMFHQHAKDFAMKYLMGKISQKQVYQELEAQVVKVLDQGIVISHIDSHQHIHMLPRILSLVISIAKKYGIRIVRFPNEKLHTDMMYDLGFFSRLMQLLVLNWFCQMGRRMNFAKTDCFFGFLFSGRLNKVNLTKVLHWLPSTGISELMCHPGFADTNSKYAHWKYNWQDELNALTDPDIKKFITNNAIELISFRQLAFLWQKRQYLGRSLFVEE